MFKQWGLIKDADVFKTTNLIVSLHWRLKKAPFLNISFCKCGFLNFKLLQTYHLQFGQEGGKIACPVSKNVHWHRCIIYRSGCHICYGVQNKFWRHQEKSIYRSQICNYHNDVDPHQFHTKKINQNPDDNYCYLKWENVM